MAWDDVSRWQPVDLLAAFRMGDAVQPVDVRDLGYREATEQIRRSIRIDPQAFESQIADLPDDRELIFYCDRPGEATSMKIALWAFDSGKSRVGVMIGGWDAWHAAGYPVEPKAAT
jgi:rhodanese-related sulfurtransferase